jgi:hypothetical protein
MDPSDPDKRVVVFCAKLQPSKRPLHLLRAFAEAALPKTSSIIAREGRSAPDHAESIASHQTSE